MVKVFIDGRAGTTGLRIQDRLSQRSDIMLLSLAEDQRRDESSRKKMMEKSDITFLCLPDEAARQAVSWAADGSRIIDTATAHRTAEGWLYGFPELWKDRSQYRQSARVAVPGCHASGFIALIFPLLDAGILSKDTLLSCTSLTGYSGGGKKMIAEYRDPGRSELLQSTRIYATAQFHKHNPEMTRVTGLQHAPVFTPILADYYAGMIVSIPLHGSMLRSAASPSDLILCYKRFYHTSALISVLDYDGADRVLAAGAMTGLDSMIISVEGNHDRMTLNARFDNLGKGASGAAIQCMNLMLGLPETLGLCTGKEKNERD